MSEIIQPDNTELLARILGDIQSKAYIDTVRDVQQKVGAAPQIDLPVFHHFAPNVYMRQMDAPAGALVVSEMHKTEHFLIFLKGRVSIITENGIELVIAPKIIKSMPGTKRIGYFHEDSSCITIHPTSSTNLDEIREQVIVEHEDVEDFLESLGHSVKELKQ